MNFLVSELNWEQRALTPASPEWLCASVTASSIQIKAYHYGPLRRYFQFPLTDEK